MLGSSALDTDEATFPDLRPWLIDTLRSEGGNTDELESFSKRETARLYFYGSA